MISAKTQRGQTPAGKCGRADVFLSICVCVSLDDDPPPKMSRATTEGSDKLDSLDYLSGQIQKQGFRTADLFPVFVKTDGPQIDHEARSPADFDLKAGRIRRMDEVLEKTDCVERHCKEDN